MVAFCFNCGSPDHRLAQCPDYLVCDHCHKPGHVKVYCRMLRRNAKCLNCGSEDHLLRDCPEPMLCGRCGSNGHISTMCRAIIMKRN